MKHKWNIDHCIYCGISRKTTLTHTGYRTKYFNINGLRVYGVQKLCTGYTIINQLKIQL
jgi:hypothetical protein